MQPAVILPLEAYVPGLAVKAEASSTAKTARRRITRITPLDLGIALDDDSFDIKHESSPQSVHWTD